MTLDNDVGAEGNGLRGGTGRVRRTGFWLGWDGNGCEEITGEALVRLPNSIMVRFVDSLLVSWRGRGEESNGFSL